MGPPLKVGIARHHGCSKSVIGVERLARTDILLRPLNVVWGRNNAVTIPNPRGPDLCANHAFLEIPPQPQRAGQGAHLRVGGASSAQQRAKAAAGSAARLIGRPITSWLAPAAIAAAGVITRA